MFPVQVSLPKKPYSKGMSKGKSRKKSKKAKTKRPGRPPKYNKSYCRKLIKFFNVEPYEDVIIPHYDKSGNKDKKGKKVVVWEDSKRVPNKLPTLIGFARESGVCYATLFNWMDPKHRSYHEEFLDTVTRVAKALQKDFLIQNGLQGLFNPQAFKFVAVNCTDMKDQTDHEISGTITLAEALHKANQK